MNDMPQDAWFYSKEGERIGPVSFADLQIKAKDGELNPRLDLVWKYGMDQWQASGEIDGLFERATPPAEAALAAEPYRTPEQGSVEEQMGQVGDWPGARRRSFYIGSILFPIVWTLALAAAAGLLSQQFGPEITGMVTIAGQLVPLVVIVYFGVKRLINVGMSGWWYLGNFVPLLNLWVGYRTMACPAGYAYHKKMDGIGIFLAILYWLFIVIGLAAFIGFFLLIVSAAEGPELPVKLQEMLKMFTDLIKPRQ